MHPKSSLWLSSTKLSTLIVPSRAAADSINPKITNCCPWPLKFLIDRFLFALTHSNTRKENVFSRISAVFQGLVGFIGKGCLNTFIIRVQVRFKLLPNKSSLIFWNCIFICVWEKKEECDCHNFSIIKYKVIWELMQSHTRQSTKFII